MGAEPATAIAGVAAYLGPRAIEGALFRTLSNQTFLVTFNEAVSVLTAMGAWGASVIAASWSLKDAVAAAETLEDLALIDINAGWPE